MIVAGGTGGHVYPALATAEALVAAHPDAELAFVGNVGGFERPLIAQSTVQFVAHDEVQSGPLHGVNPFRALNSLRKLLVGTVQSWRILGKRKPQVILSTGGWASLPVALAARGRGVPMVIYLPDIEPGLTIKVLRLFARKVAVTGAASQAFFRDGQTVITGYPLRQDVMQAQRADALAHFGLDPQKKTLLVFGGSRGARAINIGLGDILPQLLQRGDLQIVHLTGTLDWERVQAQSPDHPDYHAFDYLHDDMGLAFAAADLVVCRAGASILGECPYFELPAILIPLAYAWRYQQVNADYLAERGAAIHLDEGDMAARLLPIINNLLDNPDELAALRAGMAALAQSNGAANIAAVLVDLIGEAQ
jgi:UDP-N-acetylglucosamine--N-acetylmuramyl-(pentapeptide) pyrophosphoryl-undecaprenol N-acetylglucosamine transferase